MVGLKCITYKFNTKKIEFFFHFLSLIRRAEMADFTRSISKASKKFLLLFFFSFSSYTEHLSIDPVFFYKQSL